MLIISYLLIILTALLTLKSRSVMILGSHFMIFLAFLFFSFCFLSLALTTRILKIRCIWIRDNGFLSRFTLFILCFYLKHLFSFKNLALVYEALALTNNSPNKANSLLLVRFYINCSKQDFSFCHSLYFMQSLSFLKSFYNFTQLKKVKLSNLYFIPSIEARSNKCSVN